MVTNTFSENFLCHVHNTKHHIHNTGFARLYKSMRSVSYHVIAGRSSVSWSHNPNTSNRVHWHLWEGVWKVSYFRHHGGILRRQEDYNLNLLTCKNLQESRPLNLQRDCSVWFVCLKKKMSCCHHFRNIYENITDVTLQKNYLWNVL